MRKQPRPALVMVVAILQLVIGGLLVICGLFGLVTTLTGTSSTTVTITSGGQTRTYDMREEMIREAPSYKAFTVSSAVVDLLLHFAMIAGGIGLLMMQAWGWWASVAWAGVQIAYQLVTAGYLWFVAMPAANRVAQTLPRDIFTSTAVNTNTFTHLVWAIFATGFTVYPVLILILLVLPAARSAFSPRDHYDDEEDDDRGRRGRRRDEEEDYEEDDRPRRRRDEEDDEDEPRGRRR
jgi:hypothetical protein